MAKGLSKPKRLNEKSKNQIARKIIEVVIQNLTVDFERLSRNGTPPHLSSNDSMLAAFPAFPQVVEQIADISWIRQKFSKEYVEETIGSIVVKCVKNSNATTFEEVVSQHVRQMVAALASFAQECVVYVPLEGLTLGQDLPALQIGDANLVTIDKARIAKLCRSLRKDESEIDRFQQELKRLRGLPLNKFSNLEGGGILQDLEDLRDYFPSFVTYPQPKNRQDLKHRRELGMDQPSDAEKLMKKLEDLKHRRELEMYQQTDVGKLEKNLDDKRLAVLRRKEPIESLEGTVCARFSYTAEAKKALEYAEESAASLADLLRYALSVVQAKGKSPKIGLQGEIARGSRTMLAVTSAGDEIEVKTSPVIPYQSFEITLEHVSMFEEAGIFDIAQILSRSHGSLTEIEDLLERCIKWFSLSQMQADAKSEFLSLVIILEVLLTPSDKGAPISATIADATAILMADSEEHRKEIRRITKAIYNTRSDIVHGSLTSSAEIDARLSDLRDIIFKLVPVVLELSMRGKLPNNTKSDLMDLINSTKFQGPSVLS
jgi:hypothetical protein